MGILEAMRHIIWGGITPNPEAYSDSQSVSNSGEARTAEMRSADSGVTRAMRIRNHIFNRVLSMKDIQMISSSSGSTSSKPAGDDRQLDSLQNRPASAQSSDPESLPSAGSAKHAE